MTTSVDAKTPAPDHPLFSAGEGDLRPRRQSKSQEFRDRELTDAILLAAHRLTYTDRKITDQSRPTSDL